MRGGEEKNQNNPSKKEKKKPHLRVLHKIPHKPESVTLHATPWQRLGAHISPVSTTGRKFIPQAPKQKASEITHNFIHFFIIQKCETCLNYQGTVQVIFTNYLRGAYIIYLPALFFFNLAVAPQQFSTTTHEEMIHASGFGTL